MRASARVHDSEYLACLVLCDSFVVLGDDEHTLADIGTTGHPLTIYPHDGAVRSVTESVRRVVHALAGRVTKNDSADHVVLQQALSASSRLRATRAYCDYKRMQREARRRAAGAAQIFGERGGGAGPRPIREVERVADRVRTLVEWKKGSGPFRENPKGA